MAENLLLTGWQGKQTYINPIHRPQQASKGCRSVGEESWKLLEGDIFRPGSLPHCSTPTTTTGRRASLGRQSSSASWVPP